MKRPALGPSTPYREITVSGEMLLDLALQRGLGDGPDHRVDVLPILEEENAGNRAHVKPHRGPLVGVHVDLGHLGAAEVLARELLQNGRDDETRAAPGRPEIDQHEPVRLLDFAGERGVGHVDTRSIRRGHDVILL